jgi:hypothetical protein
MPLIFGSMIQPTAGTFDMRASGWRIDNGSA